MRLSIQGTGMRADLPKPGTDESAHGERVAALIGKEIRAAGGLLGFDRFMELALYAPGLGYYSAGSAKFGTAGDFVTAPELGFVFARCLARALAPVLRETDGDIVELGPGSGALAAEMLAELERLHALPRRYRLLERSADLRQRQRERLEQAVPHLVDRADWLDAPPADAWRGCLIANEVVDALPVRLFAWSHAGLMERCVRTNDEGNFAWTEREVDSEFIEAVEHAVGDLSNLPRPYRSEVCTMLGPWFATVIAGLERGTAWFCDYGYSRAQYYAPERRDGTLRCHWRQRAHADPLILTGLQDITAHVNLDALIEAANAAGFNCIEDASQAQFLIGNGLDEVFAQAYEQAADEPGRYRLAQEVKRLTLPGQMGDAFRALTLRRGPDRKN